MHFYFCLSNKKDEGQGKSFFLYLRLSMRNCWLCCFRFVFFFLNFLDIVLMFALFCLFVKEIGEILGTIISVTIFIL